MDEQLTASGTESDPQGRTQLRTSSGHALGLILARAMQEKEQVTKATTS
jgi:hypothetical protein